MMHTPRTIIKLVLIFFIYYLWNVAFHVQNLIHTSTNIQNCNFYFSFVFKMFVLRTLLGKLSFLLIKFLLLPYFTIDKCVF